MIKRRMFIAGTLLYGWLGMLPVQAQDKAVSAQQIQFNRQNTVYGIKDGRLYAYVDFSEYRAMLLRVDEKTVVAATLASAQEAAAQWWIQPKFAKVNQGEIDIITILNKDEYARSDFSSSIRHGKILLTKANGKVTVKSHTLTFKNLK